MLRRVLLVVWCSLLALRAGESTPQHLAVIDASRTALAADDFDRVQLVVHNLLPLVSEGKIIVFDREARAVPNLANLAQRERYSDYATAFAAIGSAAPASGRLLVVLAGDGYPEVVSNDTVLEPYRRLVRERASRAEINAAAADEVRRLHADLVRRPSLAWLLLSAEDARDPELSRQLLRWIAAQRPDARLLPLADFSMQRAIQALQQLGFAPRWELAVQLCRDATAAAFVVPEGCQEALLLTHAKTADYRIAITLPPAATLQTLDEVGVARAWRCVALDDGGSLQVQATAAGPCEVALLWTAELQHRMQALLPEGQRAAFAGDELRIAHAWTRRDGRAVSEETAAQLRNALALASTEVQILDPARLRLPAQAGSAVINASFRDPWSRRVRSEPLRLQWTVAEPLVLAGGFTAARVYDGATAEIICERRGGRLAQLRGSLLLSGPQGHQRRVELQPLPERPDHFVARLSFTAQERGTWTISGFEGDERGTVVAAAPRTLTILVARNWWPWILAALALLLLIASLVLWWWLTRPRLGSAGLLTDDGSFTLLRSCPGPLRESSHGCTAFGTAIVIQATRQGLRLVSVAGPALVWVNAKHALPGVILQPGNDIEVWQGERRAHARLFASEEQARQGLPPQIDPRSFASELVILAP
ncbi:MAG: hypothetical protein NZ552_01415 [Planctomycetes bacterium]|nr:hypothetical protein [Planctomycetota bacterium]